MAERFDYIAFISYAKEDERWAKWLQRRLEHYHLPSRLREQRPDLPELVRPIFRDTTDFSGGNLADAIQDGLESSGHLIVICSPAAARSEWVNKEVRAFKDLGREERIIPFIIAGVPFSQNPQEEAFPRAIQAMADKDELLGINIHDMGRQAAAVKVVSCLFKLRFDHLWQRNQREKKRERFGWAAALAAAFVLLAALVTYFQKEKTTRQVFITDQALRLLDGGDTFQARRLLLETLPKHRSRHPRLPLETEWAIARAMTTRDGILEETGTVDALVPLDGGKLLTLSESGNLASLNEWDLERGIKVCRGTVYHEGAIYTHPYEFSQDGRLLFGDLGDIYDTDTLGLLHDFCRLINDGCEHRAFPDPQGRKMAVFSRTNLLIIDIPSGKIAATFPSIRAIDDFDPMLYFSPDGRYLVYCPEFEPLRIVDTEKKTLRTMENPDAPKTFLAFDKDGQRILITLGQLLLVYDQPGKVICYIPDMGDINAAIFLPDGKSILSAGKDGFLRTWGIPSGKQLSSEELPSPPVRLQISPDEKYLFVVLENNQILVRGLCGPDDSLTLVPIPEFHDDHYRYEDGTSYLLSPDLKWEASFNSDDCVVSILDRGKGEVIARTDTLVTVSDVTFSPDSKRFFTYGSDETFRLFDTRTCKLVTEEFLWMVTPQILFNPSGSAVGYYDVNGYISLMDLDTDKIRTTLHHGRVNSIAFHPNGKMIASAGQDGNVHLWNPYTDETLVFTGHSAGVSDVAFSPDGRLLASVSEEDFTLRIWSVKTGRQLACIAGKGFWNVAFSSDGNSVLCSYSYGKGGYRWNLPDFAALTASLQAQYNTQRLSKNELKKHLAR